MIARFARLRWAPAAAARSAFAACLALACAAAAAQAPALPAAAAITYSRAFPGSAPAFLQVVIHPDGRAEFQAKPTDADPPTVLPFTASPATVAEVFSLARQLHNFEQPKLEAKAKVAFSGDKTLAFDNGPEHHAQTFNFTDHAPAAALAALMEKIAASGAASVQLRRTMRFDRLEVLDSVKRIGTQWQGHELAEPQLLIPVLRELAADPGLLDGARRRAQGLVVAMGGG